MAKTKRAKKTTSKRVDRSARKHRRNPPRGQGKGSGLLLIGGALALAALASHHPAPGEEPGNDTGIAYVPGRRLARAQSGASAATLANT